ncbi:MAG: DUF983 domain-containing protein [Bacteroidia bacterium]
MSLLKITGSSIFVRFLELLYMSFRNTKLYSILNGKCPRCHDGDLFINKKAYKLENWDKMHSDCPSCGLHYEMEPGFFQGAMYVSYALGVALSVGVVIVNVLFGFNPIYYFISNTLALLLFAPLLFRWSRGLYLNIFIKYDQSRDPVNQKA